MFPVVMIELLPLVIMPPTKDWSKIEKQLIAEEEEDRKKSKQSVDDFFKQIYANATDEQKRAMVKSFQTSNGTVLSTNWDEVQGRDFATEQDKKN